ncbi:bifunctional tetrahydrofolate synthase/dihydrofolate synthase [Sulfurivermis fontis]|uniref:bifunctional tetrahydrofolate synthase/dihydrofolate synthase n=1 Tax=Sulfurivermis fontis TaxID=1972068 RepID=UPI000FDA10DF|nr:bifunctional tetrahydrofolate synthase/dihydrofolate synthase [Sulfurivermis fontis]
MRFNSLAAWLEWQETLHPSTIDLGLERVAAVLRRLHPAPPPFVVITVGGTNGKGSTVAMLDAILRAGGYRVGAYTSPHLLRYNERVRLDGEMVDDAALCDAFARIDAARGDISLTYFEFGTLAALDIFWHAGVDVAILEVGMGGRLDAVNVLDADVALVTTVDIDHAQWLGETREAIAFEKAGIYRGGRPAVYGSPDAPQTLLDHAAAIGAPLFRYGRDFGARPEGEGWRWWGGGQERHALPLPALRGRSQLQNAAGVLMALAAVAHRLPLDQAQIRAGLLAATLPGRFQIQPGEVVRILDVAHNPQAAAELAANLAAMPCAGRTLAVVGMLADKDMAGALGQLRDAIDHWYAAALQVPRGATTAQLTAALAAAGTGAERVTACGDVTAALAQAQAAARAGDRIVVFGSFYTVAEALARPV